MFADLLRERPDLAGIVAKLVEDHEMVASILSRMAELAGKATTFWEYFEAIPTEDFDGHDFSEGRVSYAWKMHGTAYQHVLVECQTSNVFLVLVLDVPERLVAGHHLLNLNQIYGLR